LRLGGQILLTNKSNFSVEIFIRIENFIVTHH